MILGIHVKLRETNKLNEFEIKTNKNRKKYMITVKLNVNEKFSLA